MKIRLLFVVALALVLISALLLFNGPTPDSRPADVLAQGTTPMVTLTANGVVRAWPSNETDALGVMPHRSSVPVTGRTADFGWWRIPYPGGPNDSGWVAGTVVLPNGTAASVPVFEVIFATATPEPVTPTPTPLPCQFDSAFVTDVTVPDGTEVGPAQAVHKVWRMRNTGTCAWDAGTALAFVSGSQMSGPATATLPMTAPGAVMDIGVPLFAPSAPALYKGMWQLRTANGQFFGSKVTVVIRVPSPVQPTPAPPPQPQPGPYSINFWADTNRIDGGQCTKLRWDVEGVQAVYLEYRDRSIGVAGHASKTVCPASDGKTYVLRVIRRDGGQETREVRIEIRNEPPPVPGVKIDFYADTNEVIPGRCTTVRWRVRNSSKVQFQNGEVGERGDERVCPKRETTYRLKVRDLNRNNHDRSVKIKMIWLQ